jgi:hypothetical protein
MAIADYFQNPTARKTLYWLLGIFSVFLFLKNMWVAEDAYIILRTVDQFLHDNGFRWNPHERTQTYTSPLWFLLIIATTAICKNLYLDLIGLSLLMHVALLWVMARLMPSIWQWSAAVLLLTLSQAFFEFTGSGLEYPLAYFLLAAAVLLYCRNRWMEDRRWIALSTGLILVTRHDLLFLLLPILAHLAWYFYRSTATRKDIIGTLCIFLAPLTLWTLFSLFYYGFPFPNTAYAKLAIPGLPVIDRFIRGYIYFTVSLKFDPITPALLLLAIIKGLSASEVRYKILGISVLTTLLYVTSIGGDYMIGRFYAPVCLVSILTLVMTPWNKPFFNRPVAVLIGLSCSWLLMLFLISYQDPIQFFLTYIGLGPLKTITPVYVFCGIISFLLAAFACQTSIKARYITASVFALLLFHSSMANDSPWLSGGKDWGKTKDFEIYVSIDTTSRERYWIYRWTSLFAWFNRDPSKIFPDHDWCDRGKTANAVAVMWTVGMQGYCMPRTTIGLDFNGLVDPLMARMPKYPDVSWVPGGSVRIVPEGYVESLNENRNLITDPDLRQYYEKLHLLTQSDDLLSWERIKTIVAFNLGMYENWRQDYIERILKNPPKAPEGL